MSADEWLWIAPDGARPIGEMVSHVAGCKNMYEDHAFGPGTLTWADPRAEQKLRDATLIEHDLYHAGEINHLRSLRHADDRWAFDRF